MAFWSDQGMPARTITALSRPFCRALARMSATISGGAPPAYRLRSCGLRILRIPPLIGSLQPVLPGRGAGSEAALGAGAQPVAEWRRNVAKRALDAELERGIHRPVGVVENFTPDGDQIGLLVAQD